jgi:transcriptional adapter 2-alpha
VESPGYELLSPKEVQLCEKISLLPAQYLQVKSNIIQQSLQQGLLDKASSKRTIVKIDVEKRGKVIDFMAKAGWIASRSGGDQKPGTEPTTSGR